MQSADHIENADIERVLLQLGIHDGPPRAQASVTRTSSLELPLPQTWQLNVSAQVQVHVSEASPAGGGDGGADASPSWRRGSRRDDEGEGREERLRRNVRSSSAPAIHYEPSSPRREPAYSGQFPGYRPRAWTASVQCTATGGLDGNQHDRPRASTTTAIPISSLLQQTSRFRSVASQTNFSSPTISARQDPGAVHYPGYVQLNDFLTLPKGLVEDAKEPLDNYRYSDEEALEAGEVERQLIASVEAMLRKVHAGLQESYIQYEHPDTEQEPPPPQPVGASLRDPPPSPVPPNHGQGPSGPPHDQPPPLPPRAFPPGRFPGRFGLTRLVDSNNASMLSRRLGFIPIQGPHTEQVMVTNVPDADFRPGYLLHGHFDDELSTHHQRSHSFHFHHHPKSHKHHTYHQQHGHQKKPKASRRYKDISAIARGTGIRIVHLTRDPTFGDFGFSIKGGVDYGVGVYVSRVEEGGPAWEAGLKPGDLLLAANSVPISQIGHAQVIALLKSSEDISLTVASTSQLAPPVAVSQSYSWMTPTGRTTSPPPDFNPRLHEHQVNLMTVDVGGNDPLGLMIRGGIEYGLGVYITGVDPDSAAQKSGLQVGDQILEVNGESFLAVTHDTAVGILKYSRRLEMAVRRVAKLPHSCTSYPRRSSSRSRHPSGSERSAENLEATLTMIDEKSKSMLEPDRHARLREAVSDYAAGRIPVADLLATAAEVLNSADKRGLLTEIREVIRTEDQNSFDSAVFNHPSFARCQTDFSDPVRRMDPSLEEDMGKSRIGDVRYMEMVKTPSEDSGVEVGSGAFLARRDLLRYQPHRFVDREPSWNEDAMIFPNQLGTQAISLPFDFDTKERKAQQKYYSERQLLNKEDYQVFPESRFQ